MAASRNLEKDIFALKSEIKAKEIEAKAVAAQVMAAKAADKEFLKDCFKALVAQVNYLQKQHNILLVLLVQRGTLSRESLPTSAPLKPRRPLAALPNNRQLQPHQVRHEVTESERERVRSAVLCLVPSHVVTSSCSKDVLDVLHQGGYRSVGDLCVARECTLKELGVPRELREALELGKRELDKGNKEEKLLKEQEDNGAHVWMKSPQRSMGFKASDGLRQRLIASAAPSARNRYL